VGRVIVWKPDILRGAPAELRRLLNTATFRLAMAQAAMFALFAAVLLVAVYSTTAGQLQRDADEAVDAEFTVLAQLYSEGGMRRLNEDVITRMEEGGAGLYVLADQDGEVMTGSFDRLPQWPTTESQRVFFRFDQKLEDGRSVRKHARGRVGRLLNGPILLVARDMGDANAIVSRMSGAIWWGALAGLGFSLAAGYVASRQAARRAEALSRTARDVMAGDLTRRAPVLGGGDEFDRLGQDINAMLSRIERLVYSSRTAGDAIAHDLKSPLTRLKLNLEQALDRQPDSERDREALRYALDESEQVLTTFGSILRLAKVQAAAGWRFEAVDFTRIVENLVEFLGPLMEEDGLTLEADIAADLNGRGDNGLLTQALSNLIENAIKYTPPGGRIRVEAGRASAGFVRLAVIDSGPGVPVGERERVKERWVRLESARTTPGAGLGLSLVDAVAELHQGQFSLSDGLQGPAGPGLEARLILPLDPADIAAKAPA
jgi:signal transduction histidine kinase